MDAPASLLAMRLGKHVYCEKPLTWSIDEARRMAQTARERKVATQMGTQGMAEDRSRAGIEVVRSGVLGAVREMHVWTDRAANRWPQGVDRPKETPPVPKSLDWDLWLGPAAEQAPTIATRPDPRTIPDMRPASRSGVPRNGRAMDPPRASPPRV